MSTQLKSFCHTSEYLTAKQLENDYYDTPGPKFETRLSLQKEEGSFPFPPNSFNLWDPEASKERARGGTIDHQEG